MPSRLLYSVRYMSLDPAHTEAERVKTVIPGDGDHGSILRLLDTFCVGIWLAGQFFTIIEDAAEKHIYTCFRCSLMQEFLYNTFLAIRFQD